ncbi:MAG: alpha-hydroxy-acid oxidizing protein [Actinobacteria bacterium]|nr:alpha-hydroxy-acid oxidizing protein [Actinomycetota bacterium]
MAREAQKHGTQVVRELKRIVNHLNHSRHDSARVGHVELVNVWDYEAAAAERLEPGAYGYYAGGAGDERTLRDNVEAFTRWQLRPRVLVDVGAPSTATTVLGHDVSLPVLVAPVAYQRVAHPDGEVAMGRAAAAAGTVMCLSTLATSSPEEVAATGVQRWFQLYVFRDLGVTREMVDRAREAGFTALVLTVDTPVLGRRERDVRTGFTVPPDLPVPSLGRGGVTPHEALQLMSPSLSWKDVQAFADMARLPVVVKGVVTAEDAHLACEHGAAALVVSNHGGRQLDGVSATIDALPEVVGAVGGRVDVLLDGGIRRGTDVVKALALGARAVLAGRAPLWGLVVDGEMGARHVLELLRAEIELALQLVGCPRVDELSPAHVQQRR